MMASSRANPTARHQARQRQRGLVLIAGLVLAAGAALGQAPAETNDSRAAPSEPEALAAETGAAEDAAPDASAAAPDAPQEETAQPAPALPVTRFEAELEFDRLLAEERYEEAIEVGERMLELTREDFGAQSFETGRAHVSLGTAQREAGEFEAAEESFLQAVEVMTQVGGPYSEHLIDPLVGLGDTYQSEAEYLNAVSAYNEARTVNRRVFGLLNEDQIPILDRMTESFYAMNEFAQADARQLDALTLIQRVYEPHSPEMLEAIYKYADWLRRTNRFTDEREQYARAIDAIEEYYGPGDPRLVEPLRRIGNSFRRQRNPNGQGISSLNEALEILLAQDEPDRLQLATVLRDIGDWQTAFSKVGSDNAEYRQAWELLGDVEGGEELRREWFEGIHYVLREPHSTRGLSADPDAIEGSVVVRLDIDEHGHSHNVAIVEAEPPDFKDEAFARQVRRSRFRPQMADGVVVPARGLGLRFTFMYLPEDLEDG